jgi:hypothetical protein
VQRAHRVTLGRRAQLANKVFKVFRVIPVLQVHKVFRVLPVSQAQPVQLAYKGLPALTEKQVQQAAQVIMVLPAYRA